MRSTGFRVIIGILKDHRDAVAADLAQPAGRRADELLALERMEPDDELRPGGRSTHDRKARHGSPGRFPDQTEHLALGQP
ncbi:MAG: hypothetical protein R3E87_03520 [Burkholderiaceae bacterium]